MVVFLVVHTGLMELVFLAKNDNTITSLSWNFIASITRSCGVSS